MLDSSFDYLIPYDENDLIRVGNKNDGGYIISKKSLEKDHFLLSFGMSNEWSFEEEFTKYNSLNIVNIYDHTVDLNFFILRLYKSIKRLFYFKSSFKNISTKIEELVKYLRLNNSSILQSIKSTIASSGVLTIVLPCKLKDVLRLTP